MLQESWENRLKSMCTKCAWPKWQLQHKEISTFCQPAAQHFSIKLYLITSCKSDLPLIYLQKVSIESLNFSVCNKTKGLLQKIFIPWKIESHSMGQPTAKISFLSEIKIIETVKNFLFLSYFVEEDFSFWYESLLG